MTIELNLSELQKKSKTELLKIAEALALLAKDKKYNKIDYLYPDEGPYSRDKYSAHMKFMDASANHTYLGLFGGNGTGKSWAGGSFLTYHLTGKYPKNYKGRRFNHPITAWACGKEGKQLRDSVQAILFGQTEDPGTGTIPRADLVDDNGVLQLWSMSGIAKCYSLCLVRHYTNGIFDGWSECGFKTYDQGWEAYRGATRKVIWLDEEPEDEKIWAECIARTRGPKGEEGIVYTTMTPQSGWTKMYLNFMPDGEYPVGGTHPENPQKFVLLLSQYDVPHLSEAWIKAQIEELKQTDPYNIEARVTGKAAMGTGQVFPIPIERLLVAPFQIPEYWPRVCGLDFGWTNTAAVWMAMDPVTKIKYIYSEYKQGNCADYVHVQSLKARGAWIPIAADPSGGGRRDDGSLRIEHYRSQGLNITAGNNALIAGISSMLNQMESGLWKVFNTCPKWIKEYRSYRYDMKDPNKPADKQDDHELDASRYADSIFEQIAESEQDQTYSPQDYQLSNLDRFKDNLTGY